MKKLAPQQIAALLKKPDGKHGVTVGEEMNKSNGVMYDLLFSTIQFSDKECILEIGFGNGSFFRRYLEATPSLQLNGLDYSRLMCDEAIKRNSGLIKNKKLQIKHGDALSTGYGDETFDKVITLNTIYFWDPLPDYFVEIKRILRPGGLLAVGFRPRHVIQDFEFVKYDFNLYEAEELKEAGNRSGLRFFYEKQVAYEKKSINGRLINARDLCLVFQKL